MHFHKELAVFREGRQNRLASFLANERDNRRQTDPHWRRSSADSYEVKGDQYVAIRPPVGDPSKPCHVLRSSGATFLLATYLLCAAPHAARGDLCAAPHAARGDLRAARDAARGELRAARDAALCRSAGQPPGQPPGRYIAPQHLIPLAPWGALRGRTQPPVPEGKAPFDERSIPIRFSQSYQTSLTSTPHITPLYMNAT
jgi:hypothetical protein